MKDKTKELITEKENRGLRVLVVECENSRKLQESCGLSYLDCILLKQKLRRQQENNYKKPDSLINELKEVIKDADTNSGIMKEDIYKKLTYEPAQIDKGIIRLLEDGFIYEPKPKILRWLG